MDKQFKILITLTATILVLLIGGILILDNYNKNISAEAEKNSQIIKQASDAIRAERKDEAINLLRTIKPNTTNYQFAQELLWRLTDGKEGSYPEPTKIIESYTSRPNVKKENEYYSGMSKVDKETCLKAASIGEAKGKKDRRSGIRDNNKFDFVYNICPNCEIKTKAELATCYENGYDMGYYDRY